MSAVLLDGKALAKKIRLSLLPRLEKLKKARGRAPALAIVSGPADPAAQAYARAKLKAFKESGLKAKVHSLSAWAGLNEALKLIKALARDAGVDAITVDLPLPKQMKPSALFEALPESKDAEGVTPGNFGRLFQAKTFEEIESGGLIVPCTARAVAELLRETRAPLAGKTAVVLGRSNILGKPAAHLLSALNLTVTVCHSRTQDLEGEVRRADVVVAAMGKARLIKGSWIKKDAIVIDAGINQDGKTLCGDVEFEEARKTAAYITPVPGGVGPVTTAMLLANTVLLAERALQGWEPAFE